MTQDVSRWGRRIPLDRYFRSLLEPGNAVFEAREGASILDSTPGPGTKDYIDTPRDVTITVRREIDLPDPTPDPIIGDVQVEIEIGRGSGRAIVVDRMPVRAVGQVFHVASSSPQVSVRVVGVRLFPISENALPVDPAVLVDVSTGRPSPFSTTETAPVLGVDGFAEIEIPPYSERLRWQAVSAAGGFRSYDAVFLSSRGFIVGAAPQGARIIGVGIPEQATRVRFEPNFGDAFNVLATFEGQR